MANGNGEQARQGLREQGLAGSGRPDQEDVRLLDLDLVAAPGHLVALVVVVDRDGELLLRAVLADHVLVEERLDLDRLGEPDPTVGLLGLFLFGDDVQADVDALVADVDRGTRDQLADVALALVAERALEPVALGLLSRHRTSPQVRLSMTWSTSPYSLACGRGHDEVTVRVPLDPLQGLVRVLLQDLVERLPHPEDLFGVDLDLGRLARNTTHAAGGSGGGRSASENLFPGAPAASRTAAMLAACPTHNVLISGLMYCIVS